MRNDKLSRPSLPRGSARGAEQDRETSRPDPPSGEVRGNFDTERCTSHGGSMGRMVEEGTGKYVSDVVVPSVSVSENNIRSSSLADEMSMIPTSSATDLSSEQTVGDERQESDVATNFRRSSETIP